MSGITVVVSYQALPACADAAKLAIAALVATVISEESDCLGITMLQDAHDPTRFMLIERWPSQEIFLGPHMQQPHIQSFIQDAGAFLSGPPQISFWNAARAATIRPSRNL